MHHWKYFLILWIQCSVTLERTIHQKMLSMQCKSYLIMFRGGVSAWRNLRLIDMRVGIFELVAIATWRNLRGWNPTHCCGEIPDWSQGEFFFVEELQIDQISNYHSLQYHFSVFCPNQLIGQQIHIFGDNAQQANV